MEDSWESRRRIGPDVLVVEQGLPSDFAVHQLEGVALAEPLVVKFQSEPITERFIEIVDRSGGSVVTVIEFVSPTNKLPGNGRKQYLQKQQEVVAAGINLVEIDLTRAGSRQPACPDERLPLRAREAAYRVCEFRGFHHQRYELNSFTLRERLGGIRIPLRPTDADVVLDLQALIDTAYEEGRHDDIDYRLECAPPLSGDDAAWADALLREQGKR